MDKLGKYKPKSEENIEKTYYPILGNHPLTLKTNNNPLKTQPNVFLILLWKRQSSNKG